MHDRLVAPVFIVNWIEVRNSILNCSAATNLEVHIGDHDLSDYYTSGLQAVNDALNVTVECSLRKRSRPAKSIKNGNVI